jgi:glutathione S-transferase
MKLYSAAPSPFVRKVRMAALELGLMSEIKIVDVAVAPGKTDTNFGEQVNPLRKIPALELSDGTVLSDSSLICLYLNDLDGQHRLIPASGSERWQVLNAQAVANGMMEASVLVRYETFLRPEAHRWSVWIDEQWTKVSNGLAWFNDRLPLSEEGLDGIALACALGYLDFRSPDWDWRLEYDRLAMWHASASQRDSYQLTDPNG